MHTKIKKTHTTTQTKKIQLYETKYELQTTAWRIVQELADTSMQLTKSTVYAMLRNVVFGEKLEKCAETDQGHPAFLEFTHKTINR